MHTHQHTFDDIEAKGVTRNYNTKPNEQLHGPLKKSYLRRTNFKEVAGQVSMSFEMYTSITHDFKPCLDPESRSLFVCVLLYQGATG